MSQMMRHEIRSQISKISEEVASTFTLWDERMTSIITPISAKDHSLISVQYQAYSSTSLSNNINMNNQYKIVIVGAGMAGAMAARQLIDKQSDAITPKDILIVEALDRVGGRTLSLTQACEREPNHPVDVGGAWICPEQKCVWNLCEEQGHDIVAQQDRGMRAHVSTDGGLWENLLRLLRIQKTEGPEERMCGLYSLPVADLLAYLAAGKKLDKLAAEVIQDVDAPWDAKDAEMWDNLTVEDWLLRDVSNTAARGILRGIVLAVFCLPTTEYSMLMFLACLKAENFAMFTGKPFVVVCALSYF